MANFCRTSETLINLSTLDKITKMNVICPVCGNEVGCLVKEEGIYYKRHYGRWRTNSAGIPQIGSQSIPGTTEDNDTPTLTPRDYARLRSMANHPSNRREKSARESEDQEE